MKHFKIIPNCYDYVWEHSPTLPLFCKWHLVWFPDIFFLSGYLQKSSCSAFSKVEAIQRNKSLGHHGIWTIAMSNWCSNFTYCTSPGSLLVWLKTAAPQGGMERGAEPWSPQHRGSPWWHQGPAKPHTETHGWILTQPGSLSSSSLHSMPLLLIRPKREDLGRRRN